MTKQEEKLFQKAKSHIIQLSKIANEFEKLDLPFSISISNRFAKSQSQTTFECLKEVKVKEMSCDGKKVPEKYIACFNAFIDNKIKELEEEN